ncbi:hypothetical protein V490_00320 [Pseudogymnoascus sp. VKM F-3557]|nr:hypothetical protein V490_00320 [Pseudogymnoascus sp. VKM F-3557]
MKPKAQCPPSFEPTIEPRPVNESIQEINDNSWLLGDKILLSRERLPSSNFTWSDGKGSFHAISEAPYPPPPSRPLSDTANIRMVYDAGGVSASGLSARLSAKSKSWTLVLYENTLLCAISTISVLEALQSRTFTTTQNTRYYIILSSLTGQTITEAWSDLDEAMKQHYCLPSCE